MLKAIHSDRFLTDQAAPKRIRSSFAQARKPHTLFREAV